MNCVHLIIPHLFGPSCDVIKLAYKVMKIQRTQPDRPLQDDLAETHDLYTSIRALTRRPFNDRDLAETLTLTWKQVKKNFAAIGLGKFSLWLIYPLVCTVYNILFLNSKYHSEILVYYIYSHFWKSKTTFCELIFSSRKWILKEKGLRRLFIKVKQYFFKSSHDIHQKKRLRLEKCGKISKLWPKSAFFGV